LSARLKRIFNVLLPAALVLLAILALLPAYAKAQDNAPTYEVHSTGALNERDTPSTDQTAIPASEQRAKQPATRVVLPGDTLWTIAQERLGPDSPADMIAAETGLIFELNRERVGPDPAKILPGQELLLSEVPADGAGLPETGSTPASPSAYWNNERVADTSQAESLWTDSSSGDSSSWTESESAYPGLDRMVYARYGVLELTFLAGLFLFSLAVGAFGVSKLIWTRRKLSGYTKPSVSEKWWIEDHRDHGAHDILRHLERETDRHDAQAPGPVIAGSRTSNVGDSASGSGDQK
jgi:hypothetical protein